jgi:hypothetical protein
MRPMSGIGVHVLSTWARFRGKGEDEDGETK